MKEGVEQNTLDKIAGSGSNGRVTKLDIIAVSCTSVG